jgi:Uma2 family endonuclease
MTPAPLLTTSDYFETPETARPTELIYGALRVAEAPTVWHQQAVAAFHLALAPHVRARRLGRILLSPIDVVFDWDRGLILQPDLALFSSARWRTYRGKVVVPPDLALEVLSPQPRIGKLEERLGWFAEYGVREIWLLHQTRERFEILRTEGGRIVARDDLDYGDPIRSSVLPQFTRPVLEILQDSVDPADLTAFR